MLGAFYVFSSITLTPMIGGLVLDRIGFMGMAVREISVGRIAGAMLLVVGASMIRVLQPNSK